MKTKGAGGASSRSNRWLGPVLPYRTFAPGNPVQFLGRGWWGYIPKAYNVSTSVQGAKGQRWRI